ncbi:YT521-B-like domain-containing protein [Aspergillus karnatakaensis]|uniref:putative YT521-B-like splicing factor n=1 Tax=Aspergillus karnatakaensis TaxID=1810916 RepID=UPI003CCE2F8D
MTPVGNYGHSPSALGMGNMASALPGYPPGPTSFNQQNMQQQQQQQYVPVGHNPGLVYEMPQFQSYPSPATNPNMIYNAPYPHMYMPYVQQQHHAGNYHPVGTSYSSITPSATGGGLIQNQMDVYGQNYYNPNLYSTTQGRHAMLSSISSTSPQPRGQSHSRTPKANDDREREGQKRITIVDGSTHMRSSAVQGSSAESASRPPKSNTPKGPPRKPKQSGNALWVGNLAPGTSIVELKDYFSQDATKDLESVFLISRSNCAFVNYKSEEACVAALSRFHDTRLRGARLVCRVRRGLMSPGPHSELTGLSDQSSIREAEELSKSNITEDEGREGSYSTRVPNRYFILKSLAVEDLEISWQSGIWATQTHNEENLNRAFENADNVYLIFSANKSGEYYGYARMMSIIKDDESLTLEMPPRPDHNLSNEPDSPDVTPTPASTSAPNGRIINDVARGTIFWEADTSEDEEGVAQPHKSTDQALADDQPTPVTAELQLIGKPFRIRWLSTERVPFHRTRGLRNPWNANREVKIARDGTELEFSVGEKLVLLFHPESSG